MYVSDNDVKPDSPKEHFNLSVPALGDIVDSNLKVYHP